MTTDQAPNAAERRRWNDEYWVSVWHRREPMTNAVTDVLFDRLALAAGESVLDIGSGGGGTTIAAARAVAPGAVVGADISQPLVESARRRALEQHVRNIDFVVADVQLSAIAGAPFDVALSQFGVMFFDQPTVAFANIRRQLSGGGRIGFACWQPVERNPWHASPALAPFVPPPQPPAPGKSPTGPFTFGDPERVCGILSSAGWVGIERTAHELVVTVDRDAIVDDEQLRFLGVPEESIDPARQAVDDRLDPLRAGDGRIAAPLAFQIFTASVAA